MTVASILTIAILLPGMAYARTILEGDKAGRRALYEKLGLPEDQSLR